MQLKILLLLILAHLCTDFLFQNKKLVIKKNEFATKSIHLYAHSFLAGLLSLLLANLWQYWYVGLFIGVTHFLIDWWKIAAKKDNLIYFLADQAMHFSIIAISWLWVTNNWGKSIEIVQYVSDPKAIMIIIAYIVVIFPSGYIIEKATQNWQLEIKENNTLEEGLDKAGKYIGILERVLVLTFILLNQMGAIGFLIAAKSILRYGDKDKKGARKQTEYVLIGTLMSFLCAILMGLLIRVIGF